ncbi:MAG: hypothetical protein H6655_17095 [Ardenticatenaceae bacterium]|nr:hypothetical protein [Ardenticatenaceae bacterium]
MLKPVADLAGWLAPFLLLLLALTLPFELDAPLLAVGPLAVTNLELLLGLVLLAAIIVWWRERPFPLFPHRGVLLLLLAGGMFVGTAVLAPENNANALKASLRLLSGIALAFAIPILIRTAQQRTRLLLALLVAGLLVAAIGLAEVWLGREFGWLAPFRSGITVTGEYLRLTGPLDYANHAAMFIEATVPLLLVAGWLWWQKVAGKTAVLISIFLLLILLVQASFQTLSRASFVTIGAVAASIILLLTPKKPSRLRVQSIFKNKNSHPWLALLGVVGVLFLFNTVASDVFRLRFASEGDNGWYVASWQVPPQLTLAANEIRRVPITVTNAGALTWSSQRSQPINLGGRWIQVGSGLQLAEPRWPFAQPIVPGETAVLQIPLRAPSIPGNYTLVWDVVHEQITWFGEKSGVFATSAVRVLPSSNRSPFPEPETVAPAWAYSLPILDRSTLWRLAGQMVAERPFLGIGLDNFRLEYGRWLNADSWNQTIHTNNWYLEFLVGGGLLAAFPFFAWMGWEGLRAWSALRQPAAAPWLVAILASLLAFLIHGLLDFFLLFNSTGLLFWLLVGLWWQFCNEKTPQITQITQIFSLHSLWDSVSSLRNSVFRFLRKV